MTASLLFEQLSTTTDRAEKRRISEGLIDDMRTGVKEQTNFAVSHMYRDVIRGLGLDERVQQRRAGSFSTVGSAALVTHITRVQGYLGAMERDADSRSAPAQTIVDAGTGSSALLAVAAARYNKSAHVVAYEINAKAAACATEIVKLMGFEDQVEIVTADVTDTANIRLPDAELGLTETFAAGLRGPEPGTEITRILAQTSQRILPAKVILHATDNVPAYNDSWETAASLDLSQDNSIVTGQFMSSMGGSRDIHVYAAHYDALGGEILTKCNSDNLTDAVPIGTANIPRAHVPVEFTYETGPAMPSDASFRYGV